MKRKLNILILLFTIAFSYAYGQNTGFGGKRVLLKTDLLNGARNPLFSITSEFLVTRSFTLSAGLRVTKGKYNQIYFPEEYKTSSSYYYSSSSTSDYTNKLPDKAIIKSQSLMLEARLYVSGVVPAPRGSFMFASYNYGKVDVTGNYYKGLATDLNANGRKLKDTYYTYQADDITVWGIEAGWGYQAFLNKRMTLGIKLGFNKTFFNSDEQYEPAPLSGIAKTYGPNLLRLSPLADLEDVSPLQMIRPEDHYKGSIGAVLYVQFGVLVF